MKLMDKRIHIVEDNVQNRIVYQITLLKHGAQLHFDNTGEDTVQRLQRIPKHPDLIIMDIMLRRAEEGFGIAARIRQIPDYQHVPILVVSAAEPMRTMAQAQRQGLNGFIPKPIDATLFVDQVARVIAGEKVWSAGDRYISTG